MIKVYLTLLVGALVAVSFACSNSSSPQTTYPLVLTTLSDTTSGNTALFNFRVTKDGIPVANAQLRQTDFPSGKTFDLGIKSDTGGHFPRVTVVFDLDTFSQVAYQAVRDTLTSNFVRWPP